MEPVLELRRVGYSYHSLGGETETLQNISFSIQPGEFVAIVGPSGCGKSTLLSLICGLLKPEQGEILINGARIGYMLQKDHLLEWRTVYRNTVLGLEMAHQLNEKNEERVRTMLATYGLADFADSYPSSLSGGMRQRAALIRTLAMEPELLLLDEPFSALDYQTRLEVGDDIGSIIRREGKTALLVTHDLSEAISLGSRVIILSHRPARIKKILPISFSAEADGSRLSPLERRNAPEFSSYFQQIWKEVREHG
ncbi:ABC transporter ATP-binding protein [Cuneatibacter sp. NSJ-177]|uniref:ABC transporter ATP-binding protein n=1 Tax=Cuneatibacter sp. NSJ-177 TaxID=2931401 RepID=UPI001FCFD417|nr:ABC transporter ATP-binding protein [Cuneatibacter sp. NSJ-177]MCJ7834286.1 ABC transporter ATP-binding protein [Cuneatibacter sp. NSJ-177]